MTPIELITLIASLIIGAYTEKEVQITKHIYHDDSNKTVILWVESKK